MRRNRPLTLHTCKPRPGESDAAVLARLLDAFPYQDESGKRHVIVAMGRLGNRGAIPFLRSLLPRARGLMLGDLIRTLAQLDAKDLLPEMLKYENHELVWVRNSVNMAIKRLG